MNGQIAMDGTVLTVVPSSGDVFEMPAGEGWCERCGVMADWISDTNWGGDTWGLACCQFVCEHCTDVFYLGDAGQCGSCDSCCSNSHYVCGYCGGCSDDSLCSHCDQCESCCSCSDCRAARTPRGRGIVPGWEERGDRAPTAEAYAALVPMADHIAPAAPVPMMADFYLAEWCAVVSSDVRIRRDARTLQSAIVAACDGAFCEYVFAAIGGELRHHSRVNMGGGRETAWSYWRALSETSGRVQLIRDAVALFGDGSWSAGYGGRAWQICAEVLLAREEGRLDPRTFVDRVFSLQHNGGSLLNKASWRGGDVYYCRDIGNAHAADLTAVHTLYNWASQDGRALLAEVNLNVPAVTDLQRSNIAYAMRDEMPRGEHWTSATWLHRNRPNTAPDAYGAAVRLQEQASYAAAEVAAMVSSGAAWWQHWEGETAWSYNARLHAAWCEMLAAGGWEI